MAKKVGLDGLEDALKETLREYQESVTMGMKELVTKTAQAGVKAVRNESPRRTGAYAKGWKYKVKEGRLASHATIYNKDHYRLAHLLEKGHQIKRSGVSYGRTKAIPHLQPVEDMIVREMESKQTDIVK